MLAKPPLDYAWAVKYVGLLSDAESPDAPKWRQKFEDIIETPFDLAAVYTHEKELTYVVRATARRDARKAALFYAREEIPAELVKGLNARVNFGGVVPDDMLLSFAGDRPEYDDNDEGKKN